MPTAKIFDGSDSFSSAGIIDWAWDFGDGGKARGMRVRHVYEGAGDYPVNLTVTDKLGSRDVATQTVTIEGEAPDPPDATFEFEFLDTALVQFTAISDGDWTYEWDFGDGYSDNVAGAYIGHEFEASGTYEVTLTVTDTLTSLTATTTQEVIITIPEPEGPEGEWLLFYNQYGMGGVAEVTGGEMFASSIFMQADASEGYADAAAIFPADEEDHIGINAGEIHTIIFEVESCTVSSNGNAWVMQMTSNSDNFMDYHTSLISIANASGDLVVPTGTLEGPDDPGDAGWRFRTQQHTWDPTDLRYLGVRVNTSTYEVEQIGGPSPDDVEVLGMVPFGELDMDFETVIPWSLPDVYVIHAFTFLFEGTGNLTFNVARYSVESA